MDKSPDQPIKTFTVDEANALLPAVRPLIEQLQGLQRSMVTVNRQLEELARKVSAGNGYPVQSLKQEIDLLSRHAPQLVESFESALKQLEALGCRLKDLETGLSDFYSVHEGEIVFLCWKVGEDRVRFWHTLEGGYAGRQPIE